MTDPIPDLKSLLARGETRRLALQESADTDAVARTVAAFLNADGGLLMIGVTGTGKVVGIPNAKVKASQLKDHLEASITPPAPWSVNVVPGKKAYLIIDVPEGSAKPYLYNHMIFVRHGAKTLPARPPDVAQLIHARRPERDRWERLPALGATYEDLDQGEIDRTREQLANRKLGARNTKGRASILEELNLSRSGQLLNSAVVLFARKPEKLYPQTRVRVARFLTEDQTRLSDNRVLEGNAFSLIQQILDFLEGHIPITSELRRRSIHRKDKLAYPVFALRESILNSLVHRDYSAFDGSVSVALYQDRFEIWNPGSLPEGLKAQDLPTSGVSRPRNPDIAHVFFIRGLVERWGTGTRRIAAECLAAGLPPPAWDEIGGGVRLTLRLTSPSAAPGELGARELNLLRRLNVGAELRLSDYHDKFAPGVTARTARRDLSRLVGLGYLRAQGRGRRQAYVRTEKPAAVPRP